MTKMEPLIDAPNPTEMPGATPVVETFNLGKFYRTGFWMHEKIESLKSCTLTDSEGETFGLLVQNGAGKTTLL